MICSQVWKGIVEIMIKYLRLQFTSLFLEAIPVTLHKSFKALPLANCCSKATHLPFSKFLRPSPHDQPAALCFERKTS